MTNHSLDIAAIPSKLSVRHLARDRIHNAAHKRYAVSRVRGRVITTGRVDLESVEGRTLGKSR